MQKCDSKTHGHTLRPLTIIATFSLSGASGERSMCIASKATRPRSRCGSFSTSWRCARRRWIASLKSVE
eukprot:4446179-Prymnesium_polylepis.1